MRKILSLVLALAMALSMSVTVFAAGDEGTGNDTGAVTQDITIRPNPENNYNPDGTGSTNVTYSVNPAYTVTIPASVTIGGSDGSAPVTVSAEGVKIANGKQVVVTLSGINESTDNDTFTVALTDNTDETLEYTVTASGNVDSSKGDSTPASSREIQRGNVVLTVEAGLNNETKTTTVDGVETTTKTGASTGFTTLTFTLNDETAVKYAGTYTGTVTFTVSVNDVPTDSGTTENP